MRRRSVGNTPCQAALDAAVVCGTVVQCGVNRTEASANNQLPYVFSIPSARGQTGQKGFWEILPIFGPRGIDEIYYLLPQAGKFFRRVEFEEIFKLALYSVNSATCQFPHFRQTARFLEKFNCQGSNSTPQPVWRPQAVRHSHRLA